MGKQYKDYDYYATCMVVTVVSVIVTNIVLGAWSINYVLGALGTRVATWVAVVAGLFLGEFTVPLAVVVWVLKSAGVL